MKKCQLVLRSADISNLGYATSGTFAPIERTSDYVENNGSINRWQTMMTFNNINLRSMLGSLYRPGGSYNLKLESITYGLNSSLSSYSTIENNKAFNIFISGLPFITSYSSNLYLANEGLLASVRVPNGAQQYLFNYNNNELSFDLTKANGVEMVNISINYRDLLLNTNEPVGGPLSTSLPHCQFVFSIYLIE